ncbi:MAG: hypothetical protein IKN99_08300 [Bacteroidales bacterium]|nr:hypothetical protein [Bacteroidales bacterium]
MNPLAGFSTIIFYAYGREIRVHGFLQREVREMKRLWKGYCDVTTAKSRY